MFRRSYLGRQKELDGVLGHFERVLVPNVCFRNFRTARNDVKQSNKQNVQKCLKSLSHWTEREPPLRDLSIDTYVKISQIDENALYAINSLHRESSYYAIYA